MARADMKGIFWQDAERQKKSSNAPREVVFVPTPDTGWMPPQEWPDLSTCKAIAVDLETYDPHLLEKGPGWAHNDGHVLGIAIGADDGRRWYFPIKHGAGDLPEGRVARWLNKVLNTDAVIVGANLMYDVGWLTTMDVQVTGPFFDVQWVEALLDEHAKSYSLDSIAKKHLNEHKASEALYEWCAESFGGPATGKQRANIYRSPVELVGPYAEGDVDLPLRIRELQLQEINAQNLSPVVELEHKLLLMLVAMRKRGVRINTEKVAELHASLTSRIEESKELLAEAAGTVVNPNSADDIARAFDAVGVEYPRTAKTKRPSFTKGWLEKCGHPIGKAIRNLRKYEKMLGTFVDGYLTKHNHNGRIHGEFHPLRSDDGGTVSGRFSSSNPNLQNIPARDPELGPLIRGLFVPEPGEVWVKLDYSQVEYRLLLEYAKGPEAEEAVELYKDDPTTDFHQAVADLCNIDRKTAKNINFGLAYGMGQRKLSAELGLTASDSAELFATYHGRAPFVKALAELASTTAARRGHIFSYAGRRHRFPLFEPIKWDADAIPLPYKQAVEAYGRVRRAKTHKALNALIQGSAADIMKLAMVKVWESGVCDVLGAPLLTVHDELDWSVPDTPEGWAAINKVIELMQDFGTKVPLIADAERGDDWGHLQDL